MEGLFLSNGLFDTAETLEQYQYSEKIFLNRYFKQFFIMLLTNLSTLILLTIDGLVVGRFVGEDALNSVNLLSPFSFVCAALTMLVATGVNIVLSKAYGLGSEEKKEKLFRAIVLLTVGFTAMLTLVQIPISYLMINGYSVTQKIKDMMRLYAIGLIIANSVSVVSTVCTYVLIASGRVNVLLKLAILESSLNLVLDMVFVSLFKLGILGAGLGTAISCTVRCAAAVILVQKTVKIFPTKKIECRSEMKDILSNGVPSMITRLLLSVTEYTMSIIIAAKGDLEAVTVLSVCVIGDTVASLMSSSFAQAGNSILGMLAGAADWEAANNLGKKILCVSVISVSMLVLIVILLPQMLFGFYDIKEYTAFQLSSVRLYMLQYGMYAAGVYLTSMCIYCEKAKETVAVSIFEAFLLVPVFFVLERLNHNLIFLCYAVCKLVSTVILSAVFKKAIREKVSETKDCPGIHFSFKGSEANEVSEKLYRYLQDNGASGKDAYRLALVCEELGAYAEKNGNAEELHIFLAVKVFEKYIHVFYLDDSEPAILNQKLKATNLILGNYNLIESLASEFTYQNVSGYNNFIMKFDK